MEHWQFLIQKQGDRSWHLLESPNLEILEGEYRVLARSHLSNTDVEVRIIYSSTQEIPPKRRIFKRSRRTNAEGLMAVIPFTYFKPGVWVLRCYCDLMSNLIGKAWQYSVQVQVLPQKIEEELNLSSGDKEEKGGREEGENLESNSASAGATTQSPKHLDAISEINLVSTASATTQSPEHPDAISEINSVSTALGEPAITLNNAIIVSRQLAITRELSTKTKEEDTVIDQPVSPVWLKGETAEQILQNLIELSLPALEPLLGNETVTDSSAIQPPSLLLLTLAEETYIAHWGQTLTVKGNVELKDKTNLDVAKILSLKSLRALELRIELRSPIASKILTQVRQSLPDQELPFTINASIGIPAECKSKLILADISLYGELANVNEVIHLASQSFTITADVTELLLLATAAKSSTSNLLADINGISTSPNVEIEPKPTVSLDLKLFNLVKARKPEQSLIFNPSPNKPLPPQINLQVLREATLRAATLNNSADDNLPQLPKLPAPAQTNAIEQSVLLEAIAATDEQAIAPTAVIAKITTPEQPVEKPSMAAINLEQLLIKRRRVSKLDVTFPYLRRLKVPTQAEEVKDNVTDTLEPQKIEDFQPLNTTVIEHENTPQLSSLELLVSDAQSQEKPVSEVAEPSTEFTEESIAEVAEPSTEFTEESIAEVVAQPNPVFTTAGNPQSSPLIKKWMQSQGYSLPEVEYNNLLPAQQTPLLANAETQSIDVNLPLDPDTETEIEVDTHTSMNSGDHSSELRDTVESAQQTPLSANTDQSIDVNLPLNPVTETEIEVDIQRNFNGGFHPLELQDIEKEENREIEIYIEAENTLEEASLSPHPLSQVPLDPPIKTLTAWLAQEIVIDDTFSELEASATKNQAPKKEQLLTDSSLSLSTTAVIIESLPIPQLHLPDGELLAGNSIRVGVELPDLPPQVVVKLWVEDYQTRWLLDGPHLLTNLLPNSQGGLEVLTQLHIPFGCMEIRVEAIALDTISKRESHKVTIVRTVIPPDLPTLQIDELMGM